MTQPRRPASAATTDRVQTVTLRPRWWDSGPDVAPTVVLRSQANRPDSWEASLPDGEVLGTVERYIGSLDTKISGTRLRRPGKRRTLWGYRGQDGGATMYEQYSRSDCLRRLLAELRDRQRAQGWVPVAPIPGGHQGVMQCTATHCGALVRGGEPPRRRHDDEFHSEDK